MDITNISNKPVDLFKSRVSGVDNLAEPKNVSLTDRDGDKDNTIGQDNTSFTADALRLSSTSVVSSVSNQTQIPDGEKAKEVLSRIVTEIQNNPDIAKQAQANASSTNTARLLTEQVVAA